MTDSDQYDDGLVRHFNGNSFPHGIVDRPQFVVLPGRFHNNFQWKGDPEVIRHLEQDMVVFADDKPFLPLIPMDLCTERRFLDDYFLVVGLVRSRDIFVGIRCPETAPALKDYFFKAVVLVLGVELHFPQPCMFGVMSEVAIRGQKMVYRIAKEMVFFFSEFRDLSPSTTSRVQNWPQIVRRCMHRIQFNVKDGVGIHGSDISEPSSLRTPSTNNAVDQATPNTSPEEEELDKLRNSPGETDAEVSSSNDSTPYENLVATIHEV